MAIARTARRAFGAPGIAPRWTESAKDAIGTAYSAGSTVWFTVSAGILNEVYYPTIDRPQIRDLQYLLTDGEHFFHDERRHLESRVEPIDEHALGVRLINTERAGRYRIVKEVIADPHQPCILIVTDTASTSTALGIDFVDIPIARDENGPIRFTFFWPQADRWEGRDFVVNVERRSGCRLE